MCVRPVWVPCGLENVIVWIPLVLYIEVMNTIKVFIAFVFIPVFPRFCLFSTIKFYVIYGQVRLVFTTWWRQSKACSYICDRWSLDYWVRFILILKLWVSFWCATLSCRAFIDCCLKILGVYNRYKAWGSLLAQQLVERDIIVACIDYR